jgi:hypothetical protein
MLPIPPSAPAPQPVPVVVPEPEPAPAPEIEAQTETVVEDSPQYYITDPNYGGSRGSQHGYEGGGLGGSSVNSLVDVQETSEEGLRNYYDSQPLLESQFGSFENFKNYSAEYTALLNQNLNETNPWWDIPEEDSERFQAEATLDQEALGYSDAEMGALAANQAFGNVSSYLNLGNIPLPDGTTVDATAGYQRYSDEAEAGNSMGLYNSFALSEDVQALNEKYGIDPQRSIEFMGEDGDVWSAQWNGSGFITRKIREIDDSFGLGDLVKVAVIGGLTAGAGAALGAAFGTAGAAGGAGGAAGAAGAAGGAAGGASLSGLAGAAGTNALASAVVQGAVTGSVDASSLATAAITGGLEYIGDAFRAGEIAAGSDIGAAVDNAIWDMADTLGTDYDTVFNIASGVASGALTGENLEEIALGAVSTYATSELQNYVRETYADSMGNVDVDNWFREGETTVPIAAFNPFIESAVSAATGEDVDATDIVNNIIDFATYESSGLDAEGTLAFADPGINLEGLGDGFDINLPDINIGIPEFLDVDLPSLNLPEVAIDLPSVNLPEVAVDLPSVNLPEVAVDLPSVDLPEVAVDLPSVDLPEVAVDLPSVDLPEVAVDLPQVDVPSVETPDLPSVETLDFPSVDLPSLGMPQFTGGGTSQLAVPTGGLMLQQAQMILPPKKDYMAALDGLLSELYKGTS